MIFTQIPNRSVLQSLFDIALRHYNGEIVFADSVLQTRSTFLVTPHNRKAQILTTILRPYFFKTNLLRIHSLSLCDRSHSRHVRYGVTVRDIHVEYDGRQQEIVPDFPSVPIQCARLDHLLFSTGIQSWDRKDSGLLVFPQKLFNEDSELLFLQQTDFPSWVESGNVLRKPCVFVSSEKQKVDGYVEVCFDGDFDLTAIKLLKAPFPWLG